MTKKETKKRVKKVKREVPHIDAFLNLEERVLELEQRNEKEAITILDLAVAKLNQRIDRIVSAISTSKSVRGL